MEPLFLTADERKVFDALPAAVREGWEVRAERDAVPDDAARRAMRLQLLHLHDPALRAFVRSAGETKDSAALTALVLGMDLKGVADADLAELCFALGPVPLTAIIADLLPKTKTDDDLEGVQAIALIRHSLLAAAASSSRSR